MTDVRGAGVSLGKLGGRLRLGFWLSLILLGFALTALALPVHSQDEVSGQGPAGKRTALVLTIDGAIGPGQAAYLRQGLEAAEAGGAELLILRMDTPGGLVATTREMVRDILAAPVPVVAYVAPRGARAASAGTYLVYAAHLAVMAPGTTLGAATPVAMGGGFGLNGEEEESEEAQEPPADASERKAVEDAVAWIRSLAELRGRNADWAERAVREAATLTNSEALDESVIDATAATLPALLAAAEGARVDLQGEEIEISTAGMETEAFEPNWRIRLLSIIADPNIAFILMMVGIYGLIFELANPGAAIPGVIGIISLIVGLYALNLLPVNYAGLGLLLLGLAFMIAEAFLPSFGMLGIGGAVAFVLGGAFLFDIEDPALDLSFWTLGAVAVATAGLMSLVLAYVWRSQRQEATTGEGWFANTTARVIAWSGEEGLVEVKGEQWKARSALPLAPGEAVRIVARDGLILQVESLAATPESEALDKETRR